MIVLPALTVYQIPEAVLPTCLNPEHASKTAIFPTLQRM
jgi:hypothetical protein